MSLGVNTNVAALQSAANLSRSQNAYNTATERLSSGLRINSAKDDAAGLAVATRMDSQIRGMSVASRNAADGISLGQTAEAYLGQVQENMQRMREIAVQAANGSISNADRTLLDAEFQELQTESIRIVDNADFNGIKLFDGSVATFSFQIGANNTANDRVTVTNTDLTAAVFYATGFDVTTAANAQAAIAGIDTDMGDVISARSTLGSVQSRFEAISSSLTSAITNLQSAKGRIMDADFAAETQSMTRANILQQAGIAMLSQTNQTPNQVLQLLR